MRVIMLTVFSFLYITSCKKDTENNLQSNLNGKWELRTTDGGYAPRHVVYPAGNGNTITFSSNNHYTRTDIFDNDTSNTSGVYSIVKGDSCHNNKVTIIKFSENDIGNILLLSGDTFTIQSNGCVVADGISQEYERIK